MRSIDEIFASRVGNFLRAPEERRMLFSGFEHRAVPVPWGNLFAIVGGTGPPLVLLHGYPQTHACWSAVAVELAQAFTVVAFDLPGYGASDKPAPDDRLRPYTKRAMAAAIASAMTSLGFERFAVAGHDRGGRTGYRLALDHPARVTKLAVLDIVPTLETFERFDRRTGVGSFHWFFLAQEPDLNVRMIAANPDLWLETLLRRWAGPRFAFDPEALDAYRAAFRDPATIAATCADYRAGATVDCDDDAADRGTRKIACPMLVLWGAAGRLRGGPGDRKPWDFRDVWRGWADDVQGEPLDCGHFLPEERPAEVSARLREFFRD
jgi:haloacetate dehalogenase